NNEDMVSSRVSIKAAWLSRTHRLPPHLDAPKCVRDGRAQWVAASLAAGNTRSARPRAPGRSAAANRSSVGRGVELAFSLEAERGHDVSQLDEALELARFLGREMAFIGFLRE